MRLTRKDGLNAAMTGLFLTSCLAFGFLLTRDNKTIVAIAVSGTLIGIGVGTEVSKRWGN